MKARGVKTGYRGVKKEFEKVAPFQYPYQKKNVPNWYQFLYFSILAAMIFTMARPQRLEFPGALYHQHMETPDFPSTDGILCRFAQSRAKAQSRYRRFVRAGKKDASPWKALKGPCLPGGKELPAISACTIPP